MTLSYVSAADVLAMFEAGAFDKAVGYERVGHLSRHGKGFYKRGDTITDTEGNTYSIEDVVAYINENVDWMNGQRRTSYVQSDVQNLLQHPLTGKWVDSKSKFRQMTKENGGIEVGNESLSKVQQKRAAEVDAARRAGLREALKRNLQRAR